MNTTLQNFIGLALGVVLTLTQFSVEGMCADGKLELLIDGRYAFATMQNMQIEGLKREDICTTLNNRRKKFGVSMFHVFMYEGTAQWGDAVSICVVVDEKNCSVTDTRKDQTLGKILNHTIGLTTSPAMLYREFEKNEIVAAADLGGKPVLMTLKIDAIGKDALNNPYILIIIDKFGLNGVQIRLRHDDPFIKSLERGKRAAIRAYPEQLDGQTLVMNGYIITDGEKIVIDGKAEDHPVAKMFFK